ncbi:hypothetical protein [Ralstonia solanacearum]|uniref:hypothetical protein n=1 Tax=Ralstonia solanacearum TaxID=305 RepID=UPI001E41220B|nr:hypothetical protein [Ralstonia solanacearum]MDC6180049.1 hypothetical protein [Ralstonia solanacearum]MDC6241459.1 hypothetical protein [Ralstonia solanacearum]
MRKRDLMKALADPASINGTEKPPERAVFLHEQEVESCCSILAKVYQASLKASPAARHVDSIPLPDVELPMVF